MYELNQKLLHGCRGSSGFVQLAVDAHTGQHVAIKFVARGDSFSHTSITRELFNQRLCSGHPHIVQILVRPARRMPHAACLRPGFNVDASVLEIRAIAL